MITVMPGQRPTSHRRMLQSTLVVSALALAGCTASTIQSDASNQSVPSGELTVFAAASLTDVFTQIALDFEAAHPGVHVVLSFDGSSTLVTQIQSGAPADVFASADQANMDTLIASGDADDPEDFASNSIVIAVPDDNPAQVDSIDDLANPGVTTVLCAPEVPCGAAAERVLTAAQVTVRPASLEQNVKSVATKLTTGVADAGMVYSTDVAATPGLTLVELPQTQAVRDAARTDYPIVALRGSDQAGLAHEFIRYVLGDTARQVLADAGFGGPE